MAMIRNGFLVLFLCAAAPLSATPAGTPRVTDIEPLRLHYGINAVPGFMPRGGTATIVQAWRENGNAHGYNAWMMLGEAVNGTPVDMASFNDADTLRDDPFDGERTLGIVRFARGRIDGQPASLVLKAHLDFTDGRPLADHEPATLTIYRLTENDGIGPRLNFLPVVTQHSAKRYCNAELALRDMVGVPLSKDFAGHNLTDGCFER